MTDSPLVSLRTLIETIERQLAELSADLKALYDASFIETGASSVRFGDGVTGARPPTGVEDVRTHYRSGLGASGNRGADLALALLEGLARAADALAEMQDRIAEEGYLGTTRERRSRRQRLLDVALGVLVGIGVWQVLCVVARGATSKRRRRPG